MRPEETGTPKLMFIPTAAFGELFMSMYMLMGCAFRTSFAMREPWYSLNRDVLPGTSYHFASLAELLVAIDQEKPDLVCLFSGYLYAADKIFAFDELADLLRQLEARHIKAITSDPFLGLISRLPPIDLDNPLGQILGLPVRLIGESILGDMFSYFLKARVTLKDVPHVYVVDPEEGGITALTFYNPTMLRYHEWAASQGVTATDIGSEPYWLFVLGASDYNPQIKRDGADCVHASLSRKLLEAMNEGRRAALIAPAACIAALERDTALKDCVFVQNCDYFRFMTILLAAEYAFYWNVFSASIVARFLNRRPTFFFAAGHIADENQIMFEKGMKFYYRNAQPTYLHPGDPLRAASLSNAALAQEVQLFDPFFNNVRQHPTPDMLVKNLLSKS